MQLGIYKANMSGTLPHWATVFCHRASADDLKVLALAPQEDPASLFHVTSKLAGDMNGIPLIKKFCTNDPQRFFFLGGPLGARSNIE